MRGVSYARQIPGPTLFSTDEFGEFCCFGGLEAFEKRIGVRLDVAATYLYNVELDSEFKFRWLHFLSIVDEIRDAINDPVTRQGVGNT